MVDNTEIIVQGQVISHRCEMSEANFVTKCYYNIRVDSVIKGSLDSEPINFRIDSLFNELKSINQPFTNCLTDSARKNPYIFDKHTLNSERRIGVINTTYRSWPNTKSSPLYKSIIEVALNKSNCARRTNCDYYIFFLDAPTCDYPIFSSGSYKYRLASSNFGMIKANPYLFQKVYNYLYK